MAVKPTLVQLTTGNVDPTVLNSNLDILAEAIADTWDRSGTGSGNNTVTGDLDMNGFNLKNVGDPDEDASSLATRGWVETNYGTAATAEAEHWANYPEDQLVPEGDLVDDYSALHHAAKAAASATAAQLAETNAEAAANSILIAPTAGNTYVIYELGTASVSVGELGVSAGRTTSLAKVFEVKMPIAGSVNMSFYLYTTTGGEATAQVKVNGVDVGAAKTHNSATPTKKTQNSISFNAGDTIEIWVSNTSTAYYAVLNYIRLLSDTYTFFHIPTYSSISGYPK